MRFQLIGLFLLSSSTLFVLGIENSLDDVSSNANERGGRRSDWDFDILGSDYFDTDLDSKQEVIQIGEPDHDEPEAVTSKAPCLGCPLNIDPANEKIREMALFAFSDYMTKNIGADSDPVQTFVRVVKAESQIVAGVKYILSVELGWTNCTKSEYETEPTSCVLDSQVPTFLCDFHVVEQIWNKSKEVVHGKCLKEEEESSRITTEPSSAPSPQQDEVFYAATNDDLIEDSSPASTESEIIYDRKKRDTKNLGQKKEAVEDKETLLEIAKFAVEQLDRVDADNQARMVIDIINANKQTVSGWLYHMKIRVAQTTCDEGSEVSLEKCQDKIILPFQKCEVKILFQPWQTVPKKLVQSQCNPEPYKTSKKLAKELFSSLAKNQKPGGSRVIDPQNEDLADLVNFAIEGIDAESNALHAQKLVRIVYAERKTVSGILTKIVFESGYTKCRKNPGLDRSSCSIDDDRSHQYCNVTIVEKKWLNQKKMISSKCGPREEVMNTDATTRFKRDSDETISSDESSAIDLDAVEFKSFMTRYEKRYSDEEYVYRLGIFKDNLRKVRILQDTEQGTAVYGATMFADLTEEEFSKHYLGLRVDLKQRIKRKRARIPVLREIPEAFDWRNFSAVTPVKNQGMCGSCWAFSVTGNIEGLYALKYNKLMSFSEQELVDCDTLDEGCNGGLPENAYKAIEKLGGIETEGDYPYDGQNEKCNFSSSLVKAKVTGFVEIGKNETEMAAWLVKNGPISIGINAGAMQFYFGGVSHPWKFLCSPKSLDHGVLIVGYGVHTTSIRHKVMPYWIVKNSWGPGWGEKGYYRIYRGDGSCGVNQMTTSAIVE